MADYRITTPENPYGPLSECARSYKDVLRNPFTGRVACIPTALSVPSMKISLRTYGVTITGTNGTGGIVCNPFMALYNDANTPTPINVAAHVITTTAAYTGAGLPASSSTGSGAQGSNSPYTTATPAPSQLAGRLVAAGLRIRNITSVLNRAGQVIGLESPSHSALVSGSMGAISSVQQSGLGDINGKWNTLTYHPVDENEYDYYSYATLGSPVNSGNVTFGAANNGPFSYCLAFLFQAPTTTPQTYEFETYTVFEVTGSLIQGMTPNVADPTGVAKVQNSFNALDARKPAVADDSWFNSPSIGSVMGMAGAGAASSVYSWGRGRYYGARYGSNNVL